MAEVNTAEGCEWSSDGSLLGLVDPAGGVTVQLGPHGTFGCASGMF